MAAGRAFSCIAEMIGLTPAQARSRLRLVYFGGLYESRRTNGEYS